MPADMNSYAERFRNALQILKRKMSQEHTMHSNFGLTGPQFYILYRIRELGICKVTELADEMDVKPSAITVMIDRLAILGFVARLQDPNDRRVVLMQITDEGRRVLTQVEQHSNEVIGGYFSTLSMEEVQQMIRALEKITDVLQTQDNGRKRNGNHE